MGIFKKILRPLLLSMYIIILHSGCSKTGEIFGIDIPRDNEIDNVINDSIYYPFQDQMCEWGFRSSGCEDDTVIVTPVIETEKNTTTSSDQNKTTVCREDEILVGQICFPKSNNSNKLKDVQSKWFDILTENQQTSIQIDKNNRLPQNKDLTILTLLDLVPADGLKIVKNTKVSLPYYIFNEKTDIQLAYVSSSNQSVISPHIIDSSNGAFKVIDSNSILFLELEAKGKVGESASVSLKVQEEDATKFDKESLEVSIVDGNGTYNPVSLFFTYNTIIIEEDDSRNIYFGISYTIDSNVTVVVRSDLEKILSSDANTTLDLQNTNEANGVINATVENGNGVPFHFSLEAKGKAGDTMDLFLVARDNKGKYDFKKFTVLIVAKGTADYQDSNTTTSPNTPTSPTLTGDDFEKLSSTQQALVNDDVNNYDTGSTDRPIISIFNPETTIKLHKGESLTTSFYVKDLGKESIYTNIYDDIKKVKANVESYGKYTITHSNKFFFLTLEAVGEVGDVVNITIRSQNANDDKLFDQESFDVKIVADDVDSSYIEPLIYVGFNKLYIEEGGERTGLQFAIAHSKTISPEITVADESVAKFDKWITTDPPKFSIKAVGRSASQTSMTITASDGTKIDERTINIYIIAAGQLQNYIDKEKEIDTGTTTPPVDNKPKTCDNGFHIEGTKCVVDKTDPVCETGSTLKNGVCVSDSTGGQTTTKCPTEQHLDQNNQCVPDKIAVTCSDGFELRDDNKCYQIDGNSSVDPVCGDGYHIENSQCVSDKILISCDTGFSLKDGKCVSDDNKTSDPICQDGYHLNNGSCIANIDDPICETGYSLKDGNCVSDNGGDTGTPTCKTGFHLEDNQCISDKTNPTCNDGYYLKDGECIAINGSTDPLPPMCQDGYSLKNGVCAIDLVCETGFHIQNDSCIADIQNCNNGFHLEGDKCVSDPVALVCKSDEVEKNGACVLVENRNSATLKNIPYDEWTDSEQAEQSVQICTLKVDETGYRILRAIEVNAEGFKNELETLVLHSNKTPIINGVTQNVSIKMIYKEIYTASPTSTMLDASFRLPKFRIDYTNDYSGDTFFVIDESNGKCYTNVFPSENTIPFGILELVRPDGM